MADRDGPGATDDRGRASVKHLMGASPAAKRVAGARRNPNVIGYEETAPHWLRVVAGWSWRTLVVVAAVALVFWATTRILMVFVAVFLALVFTAVLRPLVNVAERIMPRALATGLSILLSILLIAGLFTWIGFSVAGQWGQLGEQFGSGISTILEFLEASPLHLRITDEDVQSWLRQGQEWLTENSAQIASQALSGAGSVAIVFGTIALAIFCTVFFLSSGHRMWHWFLNQLPARFRQTWLIGGDAAWYTFSGYTRGTVIVAAADGVLALVVLLVLGVPLAAPRSVLVFIGAFIPLIGAPLAMVVAMIVALAANGFLNAVLVGIFIALIGQFEGHVLQPLVMGKQVALHPVVVALSVTTGTLVFGILGAVIAVPIVAVAWSVFSRLRSVDPPTDFEDDDADDPDGRSGAGAGDESAEAAPAGHERS